MRFTVVSLALVLVGCSSSDAERKRAPVETFNPAWLPAASGAGNLLVCLDKDVAPEELVKVTMPPRLVFQSSGRQLGPLRSRESFDPKAMETGPEANALSSYAVVTVDPLTVSQEHPCVKVRTRAAVSKGFRWSHDSIPADLHFMFQVEDLEVTSDFKLRNQTNLPDSSSVKQVLLGGSLLATPVAPIGEPVDLKD